MTSPIAALDAALYAHLAAGTALITELGGTAIYNRLAPPDADLPLLIFQWQGGGDQNLTPSRMRDIRYTVKAIAATLTKAAAIDGEVDTLLHHTIITVTGWANFWTAREADIALVELDPSGRPMWHTGGIYRIRLGE